MNSVQTLCLMPLPLPTMLQAGLAYYDIMAIFMGRVGGNGNAEKSHNHGLTYSKLNLFIVKYCHVCLWGVTNVQCKGSSWGQLIWE